MGIIRDLSLFKKPVLCLCFVSMFFALNANAKVFRNAYVSFEKPPNWNCKMEGTEWVCVSKYAKKSKEAIIILTAKEMGPTDSIEEYLAYLKTAKSIPDGKGKSTTSKVLHVKKPMINNQLWVDGMHLGSEVSSYYTRYLATIKNRLAILVTFSAHKTHYTKYTNDFIRAVKSLRVVASKDILNKIPKTDIRPGGDPTLGPGIIAPKILDNIEDFPAEQDDPFEKYKTLLGLVLVLGALGVYLLKKKKS